MFITNGKNVERKDCYKMKELKKLVNVKSIVTILVTIVVCILALKGKFDIKEIYLMIIAFYFGTQHEKINDNKEDR